MTYISSANPQGKAHFYNSWLRFLLTPVVHLVPIYVGGPCTTIALEKLTFEVAAQHASPALKLLQKRHRCGVVREAIEWQKVARPIRLCVGGKTLLAW